MQSKTALRSILKKPQSIDDTTTNEGSVPTTTTEETAQSESKPVVERSTTPLESQPAAVDDDSTALLENKPALNNPRVDEEVSNGDVKVLEDVNGRIVKYDPKPRIRKTHMRAIQKKHNIEDGQLLLKFWKYASVQRQMTNLVTSNFLRSKYSK
ncbi:uncharacterized protein LOC100679339 isoform X2 [Nasonia vitripennis]|uniref:Uncharacterized protein n=1 Tax=Nasonia vitripennis TaxID=7425 RepID=A0A7M7GDU0_NASVI|nr:uncharacterized protein LOC100679339 isoform X2 [Nasonia vitripennis]